MESSAGALRLPPAPARASPERLDPIERSALQFLDRQVAPALTRAGRSELAKAVGRAVVAQRLSPLARLPERQRREILEEIENRVAHRRSAVDPRTIVRLTTVIAAAPAQEDWLGHRVASPAR